MSKKRYNLWLDVDKDGEIRSVVYFFGDPDNPPISHPVRCDLEDKELIREIREEASTYFYWDWKTNKPVRKPEVKISFKGKRTSTKGDGQSILSFTLEGQDRPLKVALGLKEVDVPIGEEVEFTCDTPTYMKVEIRDKFVYSEPVFVEFT